MYSHCSSKHCSAVPDFMRILMDHKGDVLNQGIKQVIQ